MAIAQLPAGTVVAFRHAHQRCDAGRLARATATRRTTSIDGSIPSRLISQLRSMGVIRKYSIRLEFSAISVCNDDPTEAGVPSCGTLSHAETLVPVNRVADCRAVTR